ncbi:MAG: hypothetical protein QHG94_08610, partial [Candidatus Methanosuratincola sp.]|nr:hypothetical protein [Candidatus Methanosuratincola sp.]
MKLPRYSCPYCGYGPSPLIILKGHISKRHIKNCCPACNREFKGRVGLLQHIQRAARRDRAHLLLYGLMGHTNTIRAGPARDKFHSFLKLAREEALCHLKSGAALP